jgi:enoyl-CoA hydratase/carnithine racemase
MAENQEARMSTPDIVVEYQGATTHIRLNRPGKRNAITAAMYAAMADALVAAEADGTTMVLLSGAGVGFCAGNDLADFVAERPEGEASPVFRFLRAIAGSTRILVAAVQGRAIGVGTTMLLHCDFVVAEESAELRMPFTDLALVPEAGSSLLVPRLIGHQRACGLLMLGDPVGAEEAHRLGLVNCVVADGEALTEARKLVARLLEKPRSALLGTKALMKSGTRDLAGRMDEEGAAFRAQLQTPELAAIVAGFFAARQKVA